jgi:hypothetical protein
VIMSGTTDKRRGIGDRPTNPKFFTLVSEPMVDRGPPAVRPASNHRRSSSVPVANQHRGVDLLPFCSALLLRCARSLLRSRVKSRGEFAGGEPSSAFVAVGCRLPPKKRSAAHSRLINSAANTP